MFYLCDWGDDSNETWIGSYKSGQQTSVNHTWNKRGTYIIRVKAKDIHGAESDWTTLEVSMPKNKTIDSIFLRFLEQSLPFFLDLGI